MTGLSLVALRPERSTEPARTPVQEILEILLDGGGGPTALDFDRTLARPGLARAPAGEARKESLPRPLKASEATALLCDLAYAAADLASGQRPRAVVRLCADADPWEIGLERAGSDALVTVFQGGTVPNVALFERRVGGAALCERILAGLERFAGIPREREREPERAGALLGDFEARPANDDSGASDEANASDDGDGAKLGAIPTGDAIRASSARKRLLSALPFAEGEGSAEPAVVSVEPTGDIPIVIAADLALRSHPPQADSEPDVQRSDLFSLLFRGRVRVAVGEEERELPDVFVFLVAEQLAHLAQEALEAWTRRRPYHRRLTVGGAILGIRLQEEGAASLTLGVARKASGDRAHTWTFPAVDVGALMQGVVAFGRALTRSLVRRDRSQSSNYRLFGFRSRVRELAERLREATRDTSKINASPESYRAFAAMSRAPAASSDAFGRTRLRFSTRWLTTVPSIDLRSTFLCGEIIVAGGAREISCIDRRTGELVWCQPAPRAVAVITPLGLARLLPDGSLNLHDLSTGEVLWTTRLAPRVGASASGAVVSAPGLPRMLIVSEGARHLAAVDLHTGEVRWRYAARRGGVFRLKRAGKLVIVASGDASLTALDVLTGEVVWRFCDRLRFASNVAVDQDALFAPAGDGAFVGRGGTRLHHIDPWSGAARWSVELPAHVAPIGAPLLAPETVIAVTHGRRGTGLVGFDRRSGAMRFDITAAATTAACLVVDDMVTVNSEGGELVAIDAGDGSTRYRHVFSGSAEGDRPRRLEPVLRSGALFVPQSEVHVVRPRDGTLLGRVPADIIPDLLRVDERCDVYVAEESGHLGAFTAAPRLALVSTP
jgi:outer membrane protein assembly factor BamB